MPEVSVIVCFAHCWPCNVGEHFDPPTAHTWMDQDDAEHAGHPWPLPVETAVTNPCACYCAKEAAWRDLVAKRARLTRIKTAYRRRTRHARA